MWEAKVASIVKKWESHFFSPAGKPHTSSWISCLRWGGRCWTSLRLWWSVPFFPFKTLFSFCFHALGLYWSCHGLRSCERSGYGGLYEWESWKPWLGGRASDEPHCCRVWQVGEKICGVDSLRCGALGELIRTYLGKSKGSLWETGRASPFRWGVLSPQLLPWWAGEEEGAPSLDLGSNSFFLKLACILFILVAHGCPRKLPEISLVFKADHPIVNRADPGLPPTPHMGFLSITSLSGHQNWHPLPWVPTPSGSLDSSLPLECSSQSVDKSIWTWPLWPFLSLVP